MLNSEWLLQQLHDSFPLGSTFIVAVSGGVDSMVLLDLVRTITQYSFIVVSIDHSIREDSTQDIEMVRKVAKKSRLKFFSEKAGVPTLAKLERKGLEETARDTRYSILQKYKKKYKTASIITAHHQDDQLETILFHLIRGSDVHGVVGMEKLNQQGIFRPLLEISKEEIIKYAKARQLSWREDSTNADTTFSRNFIRHHLAAQFPRELLLQASNQAKETIAAFDQFVTNWKATNLQKISSGYVFPKKFFLDVPLYVQFYILQHFTKHYFKLRDYSFSWLSSMYQWLVQSKSGSEYKHRNRVLMKNQRGQIIIMQDVNSKAPSFCPFCILSRTRGIES